jgi:plasmid stabilization system protein ParE
MRRQVRLLIAAEIDLARLVEFLAGKSPRAAVRAAATLSKAIRSLDRFADRGRQGPMEGLREMVVRFGRDAYIVQYLVEAGVVTVARVFHGREDR